jgi:ABC-type uncharacterized transport system involved in gliding motility auxiliary subunit
MNKSFLSLGALAAAAVVFLGVNIAANKGLRGVRADLTENRLYTLSRGSRNIAAKLDEPVTVKLYFAQEQAGDDPRAKAYFTRVSEMLAEYADASKGKIKLQIVDPKPFSAEEDAATAAGLAAIPTGRGADKFYFGLVGENSVGKQEVIQLFDPSKEQFLEYDITRLIYQLSDPPKKAVALFATSLPMEGVEQNPMMGRGVPPWQIVSQMRSFFDVRKITKEEPVIAPDVKVLMLVHPKGLDDRALYNIDQFVLKGGRLIVFVDPWCIADLPPGINPMQAMGLPRNSDLKKLFDAWGIEMVPERFAADRTYAIRMQAGNQALPNVALLTLRDAGVNKDDAVTGTLQTVNVGVAGSLAKKSGSDVTFEPLLQTTADSMLVDVSKVQIQPDPRTLLAEFVKGDRPLTIAARVSGKLKTAFPQGDPTRPAPPEGQTLQPQDGHVAEATEPANVIVVADADMLTDQFWVQENRIGQMVLGYSQFADNGNFVIGAIDNMSGSSDLISVRARGKFSRPFDRVEAMRKDAEQKYLAKEQELQTKLRAAEAKLQELVTKQAPQGGTIVLTPEQQAEIDTVRKDMVATRKELRGVQNQLRADIESLGTRVKVVNIAAMPVLVGLGALALSAYRVSRRRADRRAASRG